MVKIIIVFLGFSPRSDYSSTYTVRVTAAPDGSHSSLRLPTRLPPLHSTTSVLLPLSHSIAVGFNQHRPPLHTTIMAIDFSKAFDTVPHPQLISQISSLPLNHHILCWLVCYLKGRSAKCSYHHHLSSSRPVLAGVPQGSVISPALFNLFISDYPLTAPLITSYADDFTTVATTTKIPDASAILTAHSADHKETITLTYKALINSIVIYAAPIWFPNAPPSSIAKLQTIQNATLQIASGSHKMASTSHLHRETGVLPVADHLYLLCSHSAGHLCSGPQQGPLIVPPPISEQERSLPRSTRTLLSQLRSGHSRALNSYQARIGAPQDTTCPTCGTADQTTSHLFSRPNTPTHLTPLDLWLDPVSTATFLSSVPSLPTYFPPPIRPHPSPARTPESTPVYPLGEQQQQQQHTAINIQKHLIASIF
ncbi:Reverse transcriptase domain [Trinorchestia longiramus]|nr:Reverse transcriptase domain [Trinorchestia longiramus]